MHGYPSLWNCDKYPSTKTHVDIGFFNGVVYMTRNNNLWITQRVAPCGNRTRYPLRGSQLPSHRTNRAVKLVIKHRVLVAHSEGGVAIIPTLGRRLGDRDRPTTSSECRRASGCRWRLVVLRGGLRGRPLFSSGRLSADDDDDDDRFLPKLFITVVRENSIVALVDGCVEDDLEVRHFGVQVVARSVLQHPPARAAFVRHCRQTNFK
uniref:SFRICE_006750 n=1 Tax=Spodoptera frugiperda TaxID=7108 RepID=A0A2H1W4K9_SPOFR